MKGNSVWVVSVVTGVITLGLPAFIGALATVESRTGESPVAYSGESSARSSVTEDRAALLSLKLLESLKQEVSELRGLVETQDHEIQQLKKSQQDFYADLDKRVNQIQSPKTASASKSSAKTTVVLPSAKGKSSVTIVPTGATPSTSEAASVPKDELVVAEEPEKTASIRPKDLSGEKSTYEIAYNLVKTKKYTEATAAFQDYLTQYKDGPHAANAHYWMGEVYMVEWQQDNQDKTLLDKAAAAFSNIPAQFPSNPKVSDALLKLGIIENERGNEPAARKYFTDVKNRYPGSAAARIADTRLKQL